MTIEPGLHRTIIIMLRTLEQKNGKTINARTGTRWNGLPKSLKTLSKSQFKSKIKQILLKILQKTDDYSDAPPIPNVMLVNESVMVSYIFHLFACLPPISFNIKLKNNICNSTDQPLYFYDDKVSLFF